MTLDTSIALALGPGELANREHLVAVHVSSEQLSADTGAVRPEAALYRLLTQSHGGPNAHVLVHGEAGSGKTSLILRAVTEASKVHPPLEAMHLRCGEDPARLRSSEAFARYMIGTIRSQNGFSNVDAAQLARAAATDIETTPATSEQALEIGGGHLPLTYTVGWTEAIESFNSEPSAEQQRQTLIDQIANAAHQARLVVILDDTDRFAAQGADGQIDTTSISNLFQHGVTFLLELPVTTMVAVHPAYDDVPAVREIAERGGFVHVDVPHLPAHAAAPPLAIILDKRLTVAGYEHLRAVELFEPEALAQLQAIYFEERRYDMRRVLRLCEASARRSIDDGADTVSMLHVQAGLEALNRL